tara:strand:+ start:530 stop:1432 length:903 start_codon:yes stop_codon:yes gene_type:complete
MKKLLFTLLCLPMIVFGQKTYIPDNMFEYCLEGMGMGDGVQHNDSVFTSAVDTLTFLDISFNLGTPISNLIGIEDFTNLQRLEIKFQNIDSVDLSNNHFLYYVHLRDNHLLYVNVQNLSNLSTLILDENQISHIDLSTNPLINYFACQYNNINTLDLSNQTYLQGLHCWDNDISSLDLSNNLWLTYLNAENNSLTELDIRNGNNMQFTEFKVQGNDDLYCIDVDDVFWSNNNWNFIPNNNISPWTYFSENCNSTSIQEHNANKELLKITDLLGKETKEKKNQPFIYFYDNGTVKKKFLIN